MGKIQGASKNDFVPANNDANKGAKTGPTLSQQMEKAPKLGFGNAFLIGLKALGKSVTSKRTFADIRSELKREVLDTKIEHRLDKLVNKLQATQVEKNVLKGELRDEVMIRKLGLDTSPSSLKQSVDTLVKRQQGDKNSPAPKSKMDIVLPDPKIAADPKALKAHFSNFIDRVQKEFASDNIPKEGQLNNFKTLFTDFVANSLSLTEIQIFDQSKLSDVVRDFRDENRTEKEQFMEVIKNVFASISDPESEISKKFNSIATHNLKAELRVLQPVGQATFLRSTPANQLNVMIYSSGGNKLAQASKDLAGKLVENEKFKAVVEFLENLENTKEPLPQFKTSAMTPGLLKLVGDLAVEMVDQLKATQDLGNLREILSQVKNTFVDEVVSKRVSEVVAQRGNQMLGESNILLRFVTPQLVTTRFPDNKKYEAAILLAGNLIMNVANDVGAPREYNRDAAIALNEQSGRVKEKLSELLSSLNVPTSNELTLAIANKRLELAETLDRVADNMDTLVKGLPKAKVEVEHVIDEEHQTLQDRADRKSLLSEEFTLDELNELLDNTPQTSMSEEDRKGLQDLEDEYNEIMKSDK